ncbi:MAG: glycosyltransferase [Candidatus Moranbacteria bacterium]|nr:glycosyltransferase [Candidatus Moranbacteria bacterium]
MKILLLNTNEIAGGAARAAYRLFNGLLRLGLAVQLVVNKKETTCSSVIDGRGFWDKILKRWGGDFENFPLRKYKIIRGVFSTSWVPTNILRRIENLKPDIVHLHWVSNSMVKIEELEKIQKPIVWTLHDAWPFTGGCHYPGVCDHFMRHCGACPLLGSTNENDVTSKVYRRKNMAWKKINMTVVAPSEWLAGLARKSALFKNKNVICIPNGIDTQEYKPIDKAVARSLLGISTKKKVIAFGAMSATSDPRKGFGLLIESLKWVKDNIPGDNIQIVIFGSEKSSQSPDFGFETKYFGNLHDDYSLIALYSAADVFIAPSQEENLSNAVMEALSCGTPVVAFNIGGMPDMIEHKKNGYLAKPFSVEDLGSGIKWIFSDNERYEFLKKNAREKVLHEFSLQLIAEKHMNLYRKLVKAKL